MLHLYAPKLMAPGSTMPPYRYLFTKRKITGEPSSHALKFPENSPVEPGYEIVPKPEAVALVSYLMSLQADAPLFEAPLPVAPTNSAPTDATNNATSTAVPAK